MSNTIQPARETVVRSFSENDERSLRSSEPGERVAGSDTIRATAEEDVMDATESEVIALFDARTDAMRSKDIDQLMSLYTPDVVYFDIVPPLRYAGSDLLRERFSRWFEGWDGPIGMELRDLVVLASGDVAAAHMLIHASGTRVNGRQVDYWVRTSNSCRRTGSGWLMSHEHVSLPVDLEQGSVIMDLEP
jgi:ketosteroid isomerase-like protein